MTFTIGFVCTGNLCRSPAAELLMRASLESSQDSVRLWSAGTHARPGEPLDPACAWVLAEYAIDSMSHRSRRLSAADLGDADLVLCAAMEHRAAVLAIAPRLMRKTFTLIEFAQLSARMEAASGAAANLAAGIDGAADIDGLRRSIVRSVADQRGMSASPSDGAPGDSPLSLDVPDPLGAPIDHVRAVLGQIAMLCATAAGTLRGRSLPHQAASTL